MRKREFHPSQDDPERTDELPQLDPAAYEAHLKSMEAGGLDSTDTWIAPKPGDLHAARIDQLEGELKDREAELHALKGTLEVAASSKSRLDGELSGVLDRITQLEARLGEATAANAALEALAKELATERDGLKAHGARLEADLASVSGEHEAQRARIAGLEQSLAAERQAAESRLAETESRAAGHSDTAAKARSDAAALQADLDQTRTELSATRARAAELEAQLSEQTGAAATLAQRFAHQYSLTDQLQAALETMHAGMARLEQALALRDRSIDELRVAAVAATQQIDRLGKDLADREESLATLRNTLQAGDNRIGVLHDQIVGQQAALTALNGEQLALKQVLEQREQALADSAHLQEQQSATSASLAEEANQLREAVKAQAAANEDARSQLAASRAALAEALGERDASVERAADLQADFDELKHEFLASAGAAGRQSDHVLSLEARLSGLESRLATRDRELASRDERVQALEAEAATLRGESATQARQLEEARTLSQALATDLNAREAAVIALRAELATHVEALASIRRDINRIENGQAVDAGRVPLRYLIGVDNTDVVHVLNRKVMTIGRTHENDLQIRSSHISRHHARLLIGANAVILEDLGSTNGCYVNGRRIRKQVLQNEDVLMIGKTRYRFTARAAPEAGPQ